LGSVMKEVQGLSWLNKESRERHRERRGEREREVGGVSTPKVVAHFTIKFRQLKRMRLKAARHARETSAQLK